MMGPLINIAALQDLGNAVLLDCRFTLGQPDAGHQAYLAGHIPGARYADLDRDLSSPVIPGSGRHPLPDPARLAVNMATWGITPGTPVVTYDDAGGAFAARAWWLLRWLGHAEVAVLDGGLLAWQDAGLSLEAGAPPSTTAPPYPVGAVNTDRVVDHRHVLANMDATDFCLVDARAEARFLGREEPIDPVAGHIPGAINRPLSDNLTADGRFKPAAQLREEWQALLAGKPCVAMCGSGVTACHHLLALETAGLPLGRLYPGSWSGWIADPSRPVVSEV